MSRNEEILSIGKLLKKEIDDRNNIIDNDFTLLKSIKEGLQTLQSLDYVLIELFVDRLNSATNDDLDLLNTLFSSHHSIKSRYIELLVLFVKDMRFSYTLSNERFNLWVFDTTFPEKIRGEKNNELD